MASKDMSNTQKENIEPIKSINNLKNIKSKVILKKIFDYIQRNKSLEIIKYNSNIQKRLNININDYKPILIEIIPVPNKYGKFINIKKEDKKYFHIYFNDNKEEIKRTELIEGDEVSKINVVIDYEINSFNKLFYSCNKVKSINFKKFYRVNITDMSGMFNKCSSLEEINFSNFDTNNVTDMSEMFLNCESLKKLDISNFNTNKVTNMRYMFSYCSSLKELNLSNFNTNNVTDMSYMFSYCSSLYKLNLSNFNTNNVSSMKYMFSECSRLEKLNLFNFNANKVTDMRYMFNRCRDKLKSEIKNHYKNLKNEALDNNKFIYNSLND